MTRRSIMQPTPDDLIRAIYKSEGWVRGDKGGFSTQSARCNSLYKITVDTERNRYITTPI